jgi:hypothetical protein
MRNDDRENLIEALKTKVVAHEKFIISHLSKKPQRHQAFETFSYIYKDICNGKIDVPSKDDVSFCRIIDVETHAKVIDTYAEIIDGMYYRFYGRSGDAYLEKI